MSKTMVMINMDESEADLADKWLADHANDLISKVFGEQDGTVVPMFDRDDMSRPFALLLVDSDNFDDAGMSPKLIDALTEAVSHSKKMHEKYMLRMFEHLESKFNLKESAGIEAAIAELAEFYSKGMDDGDREKFRNDLIESWHEFEKEFDEKFGKDVDHGRE